MIGSLKTMAMIATIALTATYSFCQAADEDREAQTRYKGVELYSWESPKGEWVFVLMDGTNRIKSEIEVKKHRDRYVGVPALKKKLASLAVGEQVVWNDRIRGFAIPSRKTVADVVANAKAQKVSLIPPRAK